ncbi:zinc finger CCCH domain-containing protein 53 [Phtheirospermum japonicum]|uniref:Zinc finger CCCH domain-containing protein 53 n=1 Tax=Phtheirospermum japonicum TaxID=374723 RepID=A0A830B9C4_9LAMI|nr:zinc finger CCCH domain-containing protein 53 [Phtheirospermum japonicum]
MDAYEATKIVFQKTQNLDPQNASKIMGFLLIQDHGEKEMIRLAFGPESQLHSVILKTKKELNLSSPNMPSTPSSPLSNNPFSLSRQNSSSSSSSRIPSPLSITNINNNMSSTAISSSWTNSKGSLSDDLISPSAACNGEVDLIDELQLQDQLSFLNDGSPQLGPEKSCDFFQQDLASTPAGNDPLLFAGLHHRRSCSVSDLCLGSDDLIGGFGWKPCLFYARGYCKNGTSCRFLHGGDGAAVDGGAVVGSPSQFELMEQQCQEMLLRSKSTQLMASNNFPFSSSSSSSPVGANKCMNVLQFPPDSPRGLMMGDGIHKFGRRSDFGLNCVNHVSRQIYLTFPADSNFKEEDVSNYFSNFGPVQDVRIPYQQKRMFGFVTFDFPETVKLILAKGNPHFVCDARVLVKPYKEKGKIPDKHRKQQQMERGDFTGSPTGLESRDPFDLGARMFYNTRDMLWNRKLEEQADLQQAIELQNRRLMGLQLLDVKRNSHHHRTLSTGAVVSPPTTFSPTSFGGQNVVVVPSNPSSPVAKEENGSIETVNEADKDKDYYSAKDDQKNNFDERSLEHNLPSSPFASPKAAGDYVTAFSNGISEVEKGISVLSTNHNMFMGPTLFPANSSLDMSPFKSCYFQVPRFASGHETIGM